MQKNRLTSLLLAIMMVVQLVGIVPVSAADNYTLQNGDVIFIPDVARPGQEFDAYIVDSATAKAGEKVRVTLPETTNDNKFSATASNGRFWEMIDGTLMRVSGIWYAKGEVYKGRWFKFGYHETIEELTDTTLKTNHAKYHCGGNKCGVGFTDACGDNSATTRYYECGTNLTVPKDLTIIDLTGNGITTLAQAKELTDANKAVINLYVPDGSSENGTYSGHKDGKVTGTAQVVIVQESVAEGYVIPQEGDVFYVNGNVSAARRFVTAYAVNAAGYQPGQQVKLYIPEGSKPETGYDKDSAPANTTACYWKMEGGIVKVQTADMGRHDVLTLQEGKATLTAAEGHGESCVLGYANGCGGKLTAALTAEVPLVIDLRSNVTEKATTLEQAAQLTADGTAVVNTYAPDGKVAALALVDRAKSFKLTVETPEKGTISVDKTSGAVGDTVTVTATPDEGCELRYVMVDGNAILGNTFTTTATKHTVSAVFRQKDRFADDVTKILVIGSSHGVDCTNYLYDVAKDQGTKLVIGDLYKGSSTLQEHVDYIRTNQTAYNYYKTQDGTWTTKTGSNLLTGLLDEDWDIIVLMESSRLPLASKKETLDTVVTYVNSNKTNPDAKLAFFSTWRAHNTSTRDYVYDDFHGSVHEQGEQLRRFAKEEIASRGDFTWVIPAGTAVDNAATGFMGDGWFRDDVHMNGMGRVMAACTWYTTLFGKPIEKLGLTQTRDSYDAEYGVAGQEGISDTPSTTLSEEVKELIVAAANAACANPYEVTSMASYTMQEGDVVYIPGKIIAGMGCTAYIANSATKGLGEKVSVLLPKDMTVAPDSFWKLTDGKLVAVEAEKTAAAEGDTVVDLRVDTTNPADESAKAVGYGKAVFVVDASEQMTRAQAVTKLYELAGKPAVSGKVSFPDVAEGDKAYNAIAWAVEQGIVSGYGDGRFCGNNSVTIEQFVVMLWNRAGKPASEVSARVAGNQSAWATPALRWAVETKLLKDLPHPFNFPYQDSDKIATRAQVAWMLKNVVK